jgi:putative solute:sodium symporter small subunit
MSEVPSTVNPGAGVPVALILAARAEHWRRTRRITALLLAVWLGASFPGVFFARQLNNLVLFGWPLSFYLAAQGACLIYLLILWVYARRMRRLDREFDERLRHAQLAEQPGAGGAGA